MSTSALWLELKTLQSKLFRFAKDVFTCCRADKPTIEPAPISQMYRSRQNLGCQPLHRDLLADPFNLMHLRKTTKMRDKSLLPVCVHLLYSALLQSSGSLDSKRDSRTFALT